MSISLSTIQVVSENEEKPTQSFQTKRRSPLTEITEGAKQVPRKSKRTKKVKKALKERRLSNSSAPKRKLSRQNRPRANQRRRPNASLTLSDSQIMAIYERSLVMRRRDPDALRAVQRPGTECDLYVEFSRFFYTTLTRSSSIGVDFSSNCIPRVSLQMQVNYARNRFINWNYHPTKVIFSLFGNHYRLTLSRPRVIDPNDIMRSLMYQRGMVTGPNVAGRRSISLARRNSMFLRPKIATSFNAFNMRKLTRLRGVWNCRMVPKRFPDYRGRVRRRRQAIEDFRKKGYNQAEIRGIIRNMNFENKDVDVNETQEQRLQRLIDEHDQLERERLQRRNRPRNQTPNQTQRPRNLQSRTFPRTNSETRIKAREAARLAERARVRRGRRNLARLRRNFIRELVVVCSIK